ncbi:SUKH-3 domain-containing protein [Streptomyces xanthii]|uniref:SUKH-3 domain-containing protein n=1 Tax=Streptomyces xanthii TaxID=2768069 RepID=UPI001CB76D0F|nr:SUKH-3 domain-containing protein [Streptomyces xanthii]
MSSLPLLQSPEAVDAWLTRAGWHPGRRCDDLAAAAVASTIEEFGLDGGGVLEVNEPALRFVREHIGLETRLGANPRHIVSFSPLLTYKGASEDIQELADALGKKVFPVAYDRDDGAMFLVDETGRFFYQHWSGEYFLGYDKHAAFVAYSGRPIPFADEHYTW